MPLDRGQGDRGGDTAKDSKSMLIRVDPSIKMVLTTMMQHAADAFHGVKNLPFLFGGLDLKDIHFKSNPGTVVAALLKALSFNSWSGDGKLLWRGRDKDGAVSFREPDATKRASLRPAATRVTTLGSLQDGDLEHDPEADEGGSAAQQRAAAMAWLDL